MSVAQRLKINKDKFNNIATGTNAGPGGYLDGSGTPSLLLADALNHTDASIGMMLNALRTNGLLNSTYIILTAKHGQAPIDPTKLNIVSPTLIPGLIDPAITHVDLASGDNAPLIWLQDQTQTATAVNVLLNNQTNASIDEIWAGDSLKLRYPDPLLDPRTPDIIVAGKPGTVYASGSSATKIAEHGGVSEQDTHVPIVISNPSLLPQMIQTPVQTTQIAPTILSLMGLNPFSLQAVVLERTKILPGFDPAQATIVPPFTPTQLSSTVHLLNGQSAFQIMVGGSIQNFSIEASSDLLNWDPIGTSSVAVGGSAVVTDPQAGTYPNRFYRAVATP